MTLKQRRIYFLLFFLIFIIAVPILAFYSLGYRLDTDKFALVKTGGIFINADPRGVDIYVDGELKKKKSTRRLLRNVNCHRLMLSQTCCMARLVQKWKLL